VNIKEYIESGILEAYVLDALPPEERLEIEANLARYPELAAEMKAIEEGMLAFAKAGAQEPPAHLKEQVWDAIVNDKSALDSKDIRSGGHTTNVRPFPVAEPQRSATWLRAAVWIALAGSLVGNYYLWTQNKRQEEQQVALRSDMEQMQRHTEALTLAVESYSTEKDMMADTTMQPVIMKTMQPGHPMAATVYWGKTDGSIYLSIQKLPPPPPGKQYQMWMIQDGKPVSMGVIDNNIIAAGTITKMPMTVKNSQAFAISLEKAGGNETPTEVQVLGKTS
jgi:anti-sigma-K factor RskA